MRLDSSASPVVIERPLEPGGLSGCVERMAMLPVGRSFGVDPLDGPIRGLDERQELTASPVPR